MGVNVVRPPSDKSGGDIIIPSLTNRASQIERGRNEIEMTSCDKKTKTAGLLVDEYVPPGELHRIHSGYGVEIGLVTEFSFTCSISNDSLSVETQIILEVPVCES